MNSGSFERHAGFTLVEMVVVLVIASFVLGMSAITLREYGARTSARRAADMFARDLVLARTTALCERAVVSIVCDAFGLVYEIHSSAGRVVATRGFGPFLESLASFLSGQPAYGMSVDPHHLFLTAGAS